MVDLLEKGTKESLVTEIVLKYYLTALEFCLNEDMIEELSKHFNELFSGVIIGSDAQFDIKNLLDNFGSFGARIGEFKKRKPRRRTKSDAPVIDLL